MKHTSSRRLNWKKIILGIFLCILGILGAAIISVFLWMQTWRIYKFPDEMGSLRYPANWVIDQSVTKDGNELLFGTILDTKNVTPGGTHVVLYGTRILNSDVNNFIKKQLSYVRKPNVINIGGTVGFMVDQDGERDYWVGSKNKIFLFRSFILKKYSGVAYLFHKLVLDMVIRTIKLN